MMIQLDEKLKSYMEEHGHKDVVVDVHLCNT